MATRKANGASTVPKPSDVASFTRQLCGDHRTWAVDAMRGEELPAGWRALARSLFDRIAGVIEGRPVGMLVVGRLGEESGGLVADIHPLGLTVDALRAFRTVQGLIEQARRASEKTCSVCGEPGRVLSLEDGFVTRCDAHAGACETRRVASATLDPGAGEDGRVPSEAHARDLVTKDLRLYELTDVESALGRRRGRETSVPRAAFAGDPEDAGARDFDTDQPAYLRALLADGEAASGRSLAHPRPASLAALDDLDARAPHMAEVTALVRRHLRAAIAIGMPTFLPALMLVGEPGTGKSWFLSRLAALLGVPYRRHNMSGQSLADGLVGAYPTWRNAQPGLVAKCLLGERVANPLVLVDEFDKAGSHQLEGPLQALLRPPRARRRAPLHRRVPGLPDGRVARALGAGR